MDGNKDKELKHPTYTVEQVNVVLEILNKKDYYKILGLERSCTTKDAHKAYKRLSLKVHPDKNSAPGADEAFKLMSNAFQCLSNEESRRIYDRIGSDHEHVYEKSNGGGGTGGGVNQNQDFDSSFGRDFYDRDQGHPLEILILILSCLGMCYIKIMGPPIPEELRSNAITLCNMYISSFDDTKRRGLLYAICKLFVTAFAR